jgi:uncharacterized membrane protein HdeD (DUF308 family)
MTPADTDPASTGGAHTLGRNWGWFVLRGVLALLLAAIAFVFPLGTLFGFTLLFAAWAGADGILSIVAGVRGASRGQERWWLLVLRGALGVAFAVLFVLMPGIATLSYALLTLTAVIIWAIAVGVLEIATAIRLRKEIRGEWLMALSGLLSILLGVGLWVLLLVSPVTSILSVAWAITVWALIAGVALIALGLRLRRHAAHG